MSETLQDVSGCVQHLETEHTWLTGIPVASRATVWYNVTPSRLTTFALY